ncbi:MAG: heme exporter protein CcmB [Gammaproteobacteria bacterium]|nr:heme exporter protein CcmB [Gammaproteobacteria bacterium]
MSRTLLSAARCIFRRDLTLAARKPADVATPLAFFVIVTSLFPLGVGPEPDVLSRLAPGVLWVAALLASMLSMGRLFAADHADGTLEQLTLSPHALTPLVFAKVAAHWVTSGLLLVVLSPLLAMQLNLPTHATGTLMVTLLLGTPVLSLLGSVGAALTLGVRGGGVLLSLLVLPLYTPVLIFGAGAVTASASGLDTKAYFSLLGAFLLLALAFAPWATAAALRISLD